jgi:uncharacterized protein (DUF1778 family)
MSGVQWSCEGQSTSTFIVAAAILAAHKILAVHNEASHFLMRFG